MEGLNSLTQERALPSPALADAQQMEAAFYAGAPPATGSRLSQTVTGSALGTASTRVCVCVFWCLSVSVSIKWDKLPLAHLATGR